LRIHTRICGDRGREARGLDVTREELTVDLAQMEKAACRSPVEVRATENEK
jgi:hypothetical protein